MFQVKALKKEALMHKGSKPAPANHTALPTLVAAHMRARMCAGMRTGMCAGMRTGMCAGMRACVCGVCAGTGMELCMDICSEGLRYVYVEMVARPYPAEIDNKL